MPDVYSMLITYQRCYARRECVSCALDIKRTRASVTIKRNGYRQRVRTVRPDGRRKVSERNARQPLEDFSTAGKNISERKRRAINEFCGFIRSHSSGNANAILSADVNSVGHTRITVFPLRARLLVNSIKTETVRKQCTAVVSNVFARLRRFG